MRILMVTQFFAPIIGGEERIVHDLSCALVSRGHGVAVATLRHDGAPAFEEVDGVRVYRIQGSVQRLSGLFSEPERRHAPPAPDPGVVRSLRRLVELERPDVIHAHNWLVHSVTPLRSQLDAPLVLSLHDYSLACANKRLMRLGRPCDGPGLVKCVACAARHYGRFKGPPTALALRGAGRRVRAAVDMLLPVSDAVARASGVAGGPLPYAVVPNFISDRSYRALRRRPLEGTGLAEPGFLLFAGDMSYDKGVDTLLEAHAGLVDAPPLLLIGRPYSAALARPQPNVRVLGLQAHATVLEAARRSSVTVVPSLVPESFGLIALEAMAMGSPVVAARSGALPEIVADGETGLVVPPGDPPALRAALRRLLSDPALRERMGAAGRRRAERFSEEVVVSRLERIYRDLTGRRGAGKADAGSRRPASLTAR